MDAFHRQLAALAERAEPVATATVIAARGSTPREIGAKMLVRQDGAIVGSVGGGCGEAQVFWAAVRVLEEGRPRICEVDLTGEINDASPTNCGGVMEVFVDCARWDRPAAMGLAERDLLRRVAETQAGRGAAALLVAVANPRGLGEVPVGAKWLAPLRGPLEGPAPAGLAPALLEAAAETLAGGRSRQVWIAPEGSRWVRAEPEGALGVFIEALAPPPELIVVGAGHIAQPLCRMAKLLDFAVTVLDDRAAYANRERFPDADDIRVGPIEDTLGRWPIGPATHVVLVTRGHQYDEAALGRVIRSEAAYIGMIGSRRRVREVFRHLVAAGIPSELTARVHAPIGLDIAAETPAEIAVAIAAQLVQVRRAALPRPDRGACAS